MYSLSHKCPWLPSVSSVPVPCQGTLWHRVFLILDRTELILRTETQNMKNLGLTSPHVEGLSRREPRSEHY